MRTKVLGLNYIQMVKNIAACWQLISQRNTGGVISAVNEQLKYMNLIDFQPDNCVKFIYEITLLLRWPQC